MVAPQEETEVRRLIAKTLGSDDRWTVLRDSARPLSDAERRHADRLAASAGARDDG